MNPYQEAYLLAWHGAVWKVVALQHLIMGLCPFQLQSGRKFRSGIFRQLHIIVTGGAPVNTLGLTQSTAGNLTSDLTFRNSKICLADSAMCAVEVMRTRIVYIAGDFHLLSNSHLQPSQALKTFHPTNIMLHAGKNGSLTRKIILLNPGQTL